jgi:hypothetical protein
MPRPSSPTPVLTYGAGQHTITVPVRAYIQAIGTAQITLAASAGAKVMIATMDTSSITVTGKCDDLHIQLANGTSTIDTRMLDVGHISIGQLGPDITIQMTPKQRTTFMA